MAFAFYKRKFKRRNKRRIRAFLRNRRRFLARRRRMMRLRRIGYRM